MRGSPRCRCPAADTGLGKRSQSLAVDKIEKALRRTTRFLLSLFPLLYRRFTSAEDCRKRGLTHVVGRPDALDIFGLKGVFLAPPFFPRSRAFMLN